jgi:polar amino acid transport system ATP-binding protein
MTMAHEPQAAAAAPMIQFIGVNKFYGKLAALVDINAEVKKGEVVVVCGPSGSGKSTLIRTVNRLEEIQSGSLLFEGNDVHAKMSGAALNRLRSHIGFVFQSFNLFPHLSALDNVMLSPVKVNGVKRNDAREAALRLLDRVGLSDKAQSYPAQLSGGQQQRVAIARALAMEPPAMLFDEPTSALDPEMVGEVLTVMRFMDAGRVLETAAPGEFFKSPQHPRAQRFLSELRTR